jgi:hypothetical protein
VATPTTSRRLGPAPAIPQQAVEPVTSVVTPLVDSTTKAVEKVKEQVLDPLLQPVDNLLK